MTSRTPRLTTAGILVLALTAGSARAATFDSGSHRTNRSESADLVLQIRDWLQSLIASHPATPEPSTSVIHEKEGSQLDPNGNH